LEGVEMRVIPLLLCETLIIRDIELGKLEAVRGIKCKTEKKEVLALILF